MGLRPSTTTDLSLAPMDKTLGNRAFRCRLGAGRFKSARDSEILEVRVCEKNKSRYLLDR